MRRALFVVLLGALGAACGPRAAERPAADEPTAERVADEAARDEEPIEEPVAPPPSLSDAELDAMDRPELEAACYAGSTAACDRLGH